jgi:hypothetical protein
LEACYASDLVRTLKERNEIERKRLEFDKKVFEFNKQLNLDTVKASTDMAGTIEKYADMLQNFNNTVNTLSKNQGILYQQMQELKAMLTEKVEEN